MTEDESKTKWCPFVRLAIREDGNYSGAWAQTNRGEDANCEAATNCLGSACMAWRHAGAPWSEAVKVLAEEGADWRDVDLVRQKQRDLRPAGGFCGLAGEPRQ